MTGLEIVGLIVGIAATYPFARILGDAKREAPAKKAIAFSFLSVLVSFVGRADAGNITVGAGAGDCSPYAVKAVTYGAAPSCLTASPTATSTATPTATSTPTPTATATNTPTPIALPLSLANGGFGRDMSSALAQPALIGQSKDLGHAGTNGGATNISFIRATASANKSGAARIEFRTITTDGTHLTVFTGYRYLECLEESGGTMASIASADGTQSRAATNTAAGSLATGAISITTSNGAGTCDFLITIPVTTGTATSNTIIYDLWQYGSDATWSAL